MTCTKATVRELEELVADHKYLDTPTVIRRVGDRQITLNKDHVIRGGVVHVPNSNWRNDEDVTLYQAKKKRIESSGWITLFQPVHLRICGKA
jgi:hypothetical protein